MEPSYSVSDLSYQMSNYSIQQGSHYPSEAYRSSPPPSECSSPSAAESTFSFPPSSPTLTPTSSDASSATSSRNNTYHSTNVRTQRQRALRQQCSSSHLEEIANLVSRMVNSGEQCSVCKRSSPPPPSAASSPAPETRNNSIRLARQGSDTSDGSISPFSRVIFDEDENMDDDDDETHSYESESVAAAEYIDLASAPALGQWQFSWGSERSGKAGDSAVDRKCCITKDTKSRKHHKRR